MLNDPSFWCILSSAIYTFASHGRSNALFFLWTSVVIGIHMYYISHIRELTVVGIVTLNECYEKGVIPPIDLLLPVLFTVLALTRFFVSLVLRFCLSGEQPSIDRDKLLKSMGLSVHRCKFIESRLGEFPLDEFIRGLRVKGLTKGTPEYYDYCEKFLSSYESALLL
jgi:hypothetical protein